MHWSLFLFLMTISVFSEQYQLTVRYCSRFQYFRLRLPVLMRLGVVIVDWWHSTPVPSCVHYVTFHFRFSLLQSSKPSIPRCPDRVCHAVSRFICWLRLRCALWEWILITIGLYDRRTSCSHASAHRAITLLHRWAALLEAMMETVTTSCLEYCQWVSECFSRNGSWMKAEGCCVGCTIPLYVP